MRGLARTLRSEHGSLNLELGLIIVLVVIGCVGAVAFMGGSVENRMSNGAGQLAASEVAAPPTMGTSSWTPEGAVLSWQNGTPPFNIIKVSAVEGIKGSYIGTTMENSFTITNPPSGTSYYQVVDGDGNILRTDPASGSVPTAIVVETY
jgi:Flp pilus assembly pilin Flp